MKDSDKIFGCLGMFLASILMMVIGTLMNGWALSILWKWFVIPIFGLPALSIIQAIGISMTVGLLISRSSADNSKKEWTEIVGGYIAYPVLAVGIGWIISGLL